MQTLVQTGAVTKIHSARRPWLRDVIAILAIAIAGAAGYWLFPDNLALLTRIVAVALLVLSIDLIVGYCGVATLG
jgi:branched-chain amino acid transport system permease protein